MLNAVQPISVLRNQQSNTEPSHSKSGESTETGTHNNPVIFYGNQQRQKQNAKTDVSRK